MGEKLLDTWGGCGKLLIKVINFINPDYSHILYNLIGTVCRIMHFTHSLSPPSDKSKRGTFRYRLVFPLSHS